MAVDEAVLNALPAATYTIGTRQKHRDGTLKRIRQSGLLIFFILVAAHADTLVAFEGIATAQAANNLKAGGAECPSQARVDEAGVAKINWNEIRSDQEAVSCLRDIAVVLGPQKMHAWLESNGFKATFIKQFAKPEDVLLSAGWPIHSSGALYSPGFLQSLSVKLFAHSQVFSFRWGASGTLKVSQGYTFE